MVGMATIATVECGGFVADGVMHGRHLRHTKNKPRRSGVYVSAAELCSLSPVPPAQSHSPGFMRNVTGSPVRLLSSQMTIRK